MFINMVHYYVVSVILCGIGIFGVLSRRSYLKVLVSVMFIFIAASINFTAADAFAAGQGSHEFLWGPAVLVLSVIEIIIGFLMLILLFKRNKVYYVDNG